MMLSKERILELAAQAEDFAYMTAISGEECQEAYTKKFALLIVNECKEVMQLALESLIEAKVVAERYQNAKKREQAITALREALAEQAEQERMPITEPVVPWLSHKVAEQADDIDWIETNKALAKEIIEMKKQAEQEPDYFGLTHDHTWLSIDKKQYDKLKPEGRMACYAAPVRTKDLTDDEIETAKHCLPRYLAEITDEDLNEFARVVIAADREKNK